MIDFSVQDVIHEVGSATYQRGVDYFNQGKVIQLTTETIDEDLLILRAEVTGSRAFSYTQEIAIDVASRHGTSINGECTCPVGYNCKHVAAACVYYKEYGSTAIVKSNKNMDWLQRLLEAGDAEKDLIPTSSDEEFIAYLLNPLEQSNGLTVKPVLSKPKKNGGYTKGKKVHQPSWGMYRINQSWLNPLDEKIMNFLAATNKQQHFNDPQYHLSGEFGHLCIKQLIDSGRCFWAGTGNPPLRLGQARPLQINWLEDGNENKRLDVQVDPVARVLNTSPPLYLDVHTSTVGEIEGAEFNDLQWELMLSAPRLSNSDALEFSRNLLLMLPELPIPLPSKVDTTVIQNEPPIPLLLLKKQFDTGEQHLPYEMRLRFRYADHDIPILPKSPVTNLNSDSGLISIERSPEAEHEHLQVLSKAGFEAFVIEGREDPYWRVKNSDKTIDAMEHWRDFLNEKLPQLETAGWIIEFAQDFNLSFVSPDTWEAEIETDSVWFDLRFDLEIEGKRLPLLPLITQILHHYDLTDLPEFVIVKAENDQFIELPSEKISPICKVLYELYDGGPSTASMANDDHLRLGHFDALRLAELEATLGGDLNWRGGEAMRKLGRQLADFSGIEKVSIPRSVKAELRDYQKQGVNWLQFLRGFGFNGILADDMGLGKTLQTLVHLQLEKDNKRLDRPCLIIAPTSLMSNWKREANHFTPNLSVLTLQGPNRHQHFPDIANFDVVLTTYPLLVRDQETILAREYHYVILDEAQTIKNPKAKMARVVREVKSRHRLCLTGTPMENHLGELWALFDFLMPGFLSDGKTFNSKFRTPIEKHGDEEQQQRLTKRIAPFMLRRRKNDVLKELPDKTEIIRSVPLEGDQAALYESIRLSMEKKVRDAIKAQGLARSHITILDALLKLRQTCCHPKLLSLKQAAAVTSSAKTELLMGLLPEMLEEGRRILIFSQFTTMLGLIEEELNAHQINYTKLTGQTRNRDAAIEKFRQGEVDVFLISLKAGGLGLNLTEADTVIHYDPWWNPAVEKQATDRAHRIGQHKPVFVYKLITENTLEEKILDMQARKQLLADAVYDDKEGNERINITSDDLQALFSPLVE
ncbi:MAG: superfamily II DNA or RNA helicase [Candidatus Azotimanducaceae bacterium]|jgi:superfamily II DNA or RNA helicase